jgi:hypothetical protein
MNLRVPLNAGKFLRSCRIGRFSRSHLHEWVSDIHLPAAICPFQHHLWNIDFNFLPSLFHLQASRGQKWRPASMRDSYDTKIHIVIFWAMCRVVLYMTASVLERFYKYASPTRHYGIRR